MHLCEEIINISLDLKNTIVIISNDDETKTKKRIIISARSIPSIKNLLWENNFNFNLSSLNN
jgi:hypothetical protein